MIFWGEYPLKPGDIDALPPYLVNGEVYGPSFDPVFRRRGIRQMIYTSTQGEERAVPRVLRRARRALLHPPASQSDRLADGFREISFNPARESADLIGAVVAAWADMGLHTETFWLGYATMTAAGWHPGTPQRQEAAAAFYHAFYGDGAANMDRVYQLMSQQARFWSDSWEWGTSARKPLFGNSAAIFRPRQPVRDQTIDLPPAPRDDLGFDPLGRRRMPAGSNSRPATWPKTTNSSHCSMTTPAGSRSTGTTSKSSSRSRISIARTWRCCSTSAA